MTAPAVTRDKWDRPLITPLDGGEPVAYTRASTLAKTLDNLSTLMAWKQRKTAEGLARRPDLLTRVAGALATGDPDTDWPTKRELNFVCSKAVEAAAGSKGANTGTGLHSLTEALDRGVPMGDLFVSDTDRERLADYQAATADLEPLAAEVFVVCDELRTAGTFDRLWRCPDGKVRVGDLKTGKSEADYPLATAMQLAIYAHGCRYDPDTGDRGPELLDPDLDRTTGLLIHLPIARFCSVIALDLDKGWQAAQLAATVHHEIRRWRAADLIVGGASDGR